MRRAPSVKRLVEAFNITTAQAREIRLLCHCVDDREVLRERIEKHHPATEEYQRKLLNDPYFSAMWRRTVVLHALDVMLNMHGVEALGEGEGRSFAPPYEYLNAGDSYTSTLIYKREADEIVIGCWADYAPEEAEAG